MIVQLEPALENTAHALGYQSAVDFARIELKHRAAQQLAYFRSRVELYEQKYGMSFEDFTQRVPNPDDAALKRFGIFEKEDDGMDWENSVHSMRFYQDQLDALIRGGNA